ncbi:CRE-SRV-4 protein [Caenorhabditis remanei]|uniref:CRE-SRV-4 protein n=1 Tax=Caenorhabditis remanei TaxID=31234 RepID=E3N6G3_CAERE|nr:CRE-SRV-4 protein [Caenorhabditis remanei]
MKLDALQDIIISTACFLLSSVLYLLTFIHLIQQLPKDISVPYFTSRKTRNSKLNTPTDLIIFKCAFFSFVLFTPNFAKTIVLYFATSPQIIDIGTELW